MFEAVRAHPYRSNIVVALIVASGLGIQGTAATGARPGDSEINETCTPLKLISVKSIEADGTVTPAPGPGRGTLYTYSDGGGTVTMVVPPRGFNPLVASDKALATFGLPPRPDSAGDRAAWNAAFARWRGSAKPGLCVNHNRRFGGKDP